MTLKIIHKNNTSAGQAPAPSDLDIGEIGINSADAKLYVEDNDGVIQSFTNDNDAATVQRFTQAGSGAVQRTVESKLRDVVSVKDFGAVGDGIVDDTAAIQAAIDSSPHVIFPQGTYSINQSLDIAFTNSYIEGVGTVEILQQDYPQHVFYVDKDNCTIKNIKMRGVPTKTLLSESLGNRYYGGLLRSKSSSIYLHSSDGLNILNCSSVNFINGIYFKGGDDVSWVTSDGSDSGRMTSTTFELSSVDQRADNYWTGGYIRILTNSGSTSTSRISAYDSSTNTITFTSTQTPITLTGNNQWNYDLVLGRSKNIVVDGCYFDLIDFGLVGGYVENLEVRNSIFETIEQTQQVNVRPHSIYLTGGDNRNVRCSDLVTYSCESGQAYKLIGIDTLFMSDLDSKNSRGTVTVEACKNVTAHNLTCLLSGHTDAGFAPSVINFSACARVYLSGLRLSLDPAYTQTVATARPFAINVNGTDDVGRGDLGTMLANDPIQCEDFHVTDVVIDGGDTYTGVINGVKCFGTTARPVINSVFENFSLISGANANYTAARFNDCDNLIFRNPSFSVTPSTFSIQFDANCSNSKAVSIPDQLNFSFTNNGTNNEVVYSSPFTRGTWTPVIEGSTVAGSNTYSSQLGDWSRVGDIVFVMARINLTNLASTGNISISGLPFPSATYSLGPGASGVQGGVLGNYGNVNFTGAPSLRIPVNSTSIDLVYNGTTGVSKVTHAELTNTSYLIFFFCYRASFP